MFGVVWIATARLSMHCLVVAAAGWVAGRLDRAHVLVNTLIFATTLAIRDSGWLRGPLDLESLFTNLMPRTFLLGCLIAGALLSRRPRPVVSIFRETSGAG